MAYATGTRLLAYTFIILGFVTVIGIPVFWPLAYILIGEAKTKEKEREQEIDAMSG